MAILLRRGLIPPFALQTETLAWVAAVVSDGGTVSDARALIVNALIVSLKSAGVWTKLDRLWLFAAENTQSALRDIVAASAASAVSSPSFTIDRGYTGDGAASYIDTLFNASTAPSPQFQQNSAHYSHWNLTNSTTDQGYSGNSNNGTGWLYFSGSAFLRCNDTGGGETLSDPRGHVISTRFDAGNRRSYLNGVAQNTTGAASASVVNANFFVLQDHNSFSATQCSAYSLGGDLSGGSNALDFYNALRTYMTAVGVP